MYSSKNRFGNLLLVVALVGGAFLGAPSEGKAAYIVTLTSGANTLVINDNIAPDVNPALNKITVFSVSFAGYTIDFNGNSNTPGENGLALQTSQTLTVRANGATAALQIAVYADGYLPELSSPIALNVNNSISTTLIQGSTTASATTLINGGGAGLTTSTVSLTGPIIAGSKQSPLLTTIPTATPFSMTSRLVISNMSNNNQANVTWTSSATAVPVPGGLALLASAIPVLCGAGWLRRRKSGAQADNA